MNPALIILLVLAINVAVWIPIILWYRKKKAALLREAEDSILLAGEHAVIEPRSALVRRPILRWLGVQSGNAVVALTDRRLIIKPLVGPQTDIPRDDIVEVSESKWYGGNYVAVYTHVVLRLEDGQRFAIVVKDPQPWLEGLESSRRG